jgi:hypothetical protein
MIENTLFDQLKKRNFQDESIESLKKASIFVPARPKEVLYDLPRDLSEIEDKMLANFLVNYENHAGWIRYCISLREIESEKYKKLLQVGRDMLIKKFSGKATEIKSMINSSDDILELEENYLKIMSDLKLMEVTLEHIVNLSKAISREITIRGFSNEAYPYNRTRVSME